MGPLLPLEGRGRGPGGESHAEQPLAAGWALPQEQGLISLGNCPSWGVRKTPNPPTHQCGGCLRASRHGGKFAPGNEVPGIRGREGAQAGGSGGLWEAHSGGELGVCTLRARPRRSHNPARGPAFLCQSQQAVGERLSWTPSCPQGLVPVTSSAPEDTAAPELLPAPAGVGVTKCHTEPPGPPRRLPGCVPTVWRGEAVRLVRGGASMPTDKGAAAVGSDSASWAHRGPRGVRGPSPERVPGALPGAGVLRGTDDSVREKSRSRDRAKALACVSRECAGPGRTGAPQSDPSRSHPHTLTLTLTPQQNLRPGPSSPGSSVAERECG